MGLGAACDGESNHDLHLSSNELVLLLLGWECHCFAMSVAMARACGWPGTGNKDISHSQGGDNRSQTQLRHRM